VSDGPLDLRDYLGVLWLRKWSIFIVTVTTVAVALFFSYRQTPVYLSTAEVVVKAARFDPSQPSAAYGFVNMLTEERIANSNPVSDLARQRLADQGIEPGSTSAAFQEGTETIQFTSGSPDAAAAQATAQAYADAYLAYRRVSVLSDLEASRRPLEDQLSELKQKLRTTAVALGAAVTPTEAERLNTRYAALLTQQGNVVQALSELPSPESIRIGDVLQPGSFPVSPSEPDHLIAAILGIVVGLAIGVGAALFKERLDEGFRGRDDLELQSGAPVLAFVPRLPSQRRNPVMLANPSSPGAEAYRALRLRLLHASEGQGFRTIVATSSVAGEGKSSVTANLSVALAQAGKQVVVVSADLRRPSLHEYFPTGDGSGLREVLVGKMSPGDAPSRTKIENLRVLHAGHTVASDELDLLGSSGMSDLLTRLTAFADFVLIDTPPLLAASEAAALAKIADGVLFVIDPRRVQKHTVEQARLQLQLVGAHVIGVVVNNYDPRRFRPYSSRYRYDEHPSGDRARPATHAPSTVLVKTADGDADRPSQVPESGNQWQAGR
jgi:capsular exopolysaccharide synthesis family protein